MTDVELRDVLEIVRNGQLPLDEAVARFAGSAVGSLDYASVDLERQHRCGFPEVIFCTGKTPEWVEGVVRKLAEAGQDCLATRVSDNQSVHLARQFPHGSQDRLARTFWLPAGERKASIGTVTIITAGTSALPAAQ